MVHVKAHSFKHQVCWRWSLNSRKKSPPWWLHNNWLPHRSKSDQTPEAKLKRDSSTNGKLLWHYCTIPWSCTPRRGLSKGQNNLNLGNILLWGDIGVLPAMTSIRIPVSSSCLSAGAPHHQPPWPAVAGAPQAPAPEPAGSSSDQSRAAPTPQPEAWAYMWRSGWGPVRGTRVRHSPGWLGLWGWAGMSACRAYRQARQGRAGQGRGKAGARPQAGLKWGCCARGQSEWVKAPREARQGTDIMLNADRLAF